MPLPPLVLGSRSPRRKDLLRDMPGIQAEAIRVIPPRESDEAGFDDIDTEEAIRTRLIEIVAAKQTDVRQQVAEFVASGSLGDSCFVLTADTIILPGNVDLVLGQPPDQNWQPVVRDWFRRYYRGQWHRAWTGVLLATPDQTVHSLVCETQVQMAELDDETVDAYLRTGESLGKAGGYGIQGHAAAFITGLRGSLTNVIGLPVLETHQLLIDGGYFDASNHEHK